MTSLPAPHPGGRPTDYRPEFCEQVVNLARIGMGRAEIAATLGVVRATLANWERAHPEFLAAMERAGEMSLAWWSEQGRKGIWAGKEFNAPAYSLQVRNRFPADFRDKVDLTHAGPDGGPIQTEATMRPDLSGLSQHDRDQLRAILERVAHGSESGPSRA